MPREEDVFHALTELPSVDSWPDISDREREHRERVLWDIALRVMEDGPRKAVPAPERGRQFMPFAALKGYEEMLAEVELRSMGEDEDARGESPCGPADN